MPWIVERKDELDYGFKEGSLIIKDNERSNFEIARIFGSDSGEICIFINKGVIFVYEDGEETVCHPLMGQENYCGTKFSIQESGELLYRHHSSGQISIKIIKLDMDDCIVVKNGTPHSLLKIFLKRLFSWLH